MTKSNTQQSWPLQSWLLGATTAQRAAKLGDLVIATSQIDRTAHAFSQAVHEELAAALARGEAVEYGTIRWAEQQWRENSCK